MKILKKPKFLPVTCSRCGCIYQPKKRNLTTFPDSTIKDVVICPICKTINPANFEIKAVNENECIS